MKLLFDENLSRRLVSFLGDVFPESKHIEDLGLRGATDETIWETAQWLEFVIVSKDDDFRQRALLLGSPPKVVWLSVGNAGTRRIATLLRRHHDAIAEFATRPEESLFVLVDVERR